VSPSSPVPRARIVEAGDAARRRIERDLHDGAQQRLVSLAIAVRMTEGRIHDDPVTAAALVAAAREEASQSPEELRELARGIHPAVVEHGLEVALESPASRSQTPVSLDLEPDERLPAPVELAAYFVACEGLANVGKYARASRAGGSGRRGLADRVEALAGDCGSPAPPAAARCSRRRCRARCGQPHADVWEIPEPGHMGGLKVRPREYEERVVASFDDALNPRRR
jgi:hypothetical protein